MNARLLPFALIALLSGCGVTRESDFAPVCPKYDTDIQPLLTRECARCHGATTDGGYAVTSYLEAIQPSINDLQRVVPGQADSPLLVAARGESEPHRFISNADLETLTKWVVSCNAAPSPTEYHPVGWGSPLDADNFHGAALRKVGYLTFECQKCHGSDLRGGKARVDCNSCHTNGPFACNTCHGDDKSPAPGKALNRSRSRSTLGVGAHQAHLRDNELHAALTCASCHPTITNAEDEGHYRFGSQFVSDMPVVRLPAPAMSTEPAVWDRGTATCTNVACHAPKAADTKASKPAPVWTSTSGEEKKCGACHGLGPLGHQNTHCEGCHTTGYADGGVDLPFHMNGKIDLGEAKRCDVCHAPPETKAFYDTHDDRDAGSRSVGAHTAHLVGGHLRAALECRDCHVVPTSALSVGHVDTPSPAEVFPANWDGGTGAASLDGVQPSYDPTAGTCTVYCHGAGQHLVAVDQSTDLIRAPVWNGVTQAKCGSCHGTPPRDGKLGHTIATSLQTCSQCHGLTVLPDGGIRFFDLPDGGQTTFHINGVVNGNN